MDIEKWENLKKERDKTFSDPNFLKWAKELNVGVAYQNFYHNNTHFMMSQYNYNKKTFSLKKNKYFY